MIGNAKEKYGSCKLRKNNPHILYKSTIKKALYCITVLIYNEYLETLKQSQKDCTESEDIRCKRTVPVSYKD